MRCSIIIQFHLIFITLLNPSHSVSQSFIHSFTLCWLGNLFIYYVYLSIHLSITLHGIVFNILFRQFLKSFGIGIDKKIQLFFERENRIYYYLQEMSLYNCVHVNLHDFNSTWNISPFFRIQMEYNYLIVHKHNKYV